MFFSKVLCVTWFKDISKLKINASNNLWYLILISNWLIHILMENNENKISNVANFVVNGKDSSGELMAFYLGNSKMRLWLFNICNCECNKNSKWKTSTSELIFESFLKQIADNVIVLTSRYSHKLSEVICNTVTAEIHIKYVSDVCSSFYKSKSKAIPSFFFFFGTC